MQPITKSQLREIFELLNQQCHLPIQKFCIVFQHTGIGNPKLLTKKTATEVIKYLNNNDSCDRMRNRIWAIAYEENIVINSCTNDAEKIKQIQLQQFLFINGITDKEFNSLSKNELVITVKLLQQVIQDKHIEEANRSTENLLRELNISVEKKIKPHGNY